MASSPKQRALDLVRAGQNAATAAREVGVTRQAVHQCVQAWESERGEQLTAKRLSPEARGDAPLPEDPGERAVDTEFSGLEQPAPKLISLALVREEGLSCCGCVLLAVRCTTGM